MGCVVVRTRYAFVALAALSLILAAVAYLAAVGYYHDQQAVTRAEIRSSCGFWSLLGALDPVTTAAPKPSMAVVTLVADSRDSYIGQGCLPPLPPPGRDLSKWAAYYHLALR